ERRHFDRGERIHVTRRQPSKSAIPEAGLLFLREDFVKVVAKSAQGLARRLGDAEVEQVVREMRSGQIFRGEIRDTARVGSPVVLPARDSALEESVAHGQREREVEIVLRRGGFHSPKSATEIFAERLFD